MVEKIDLRPKVLELIQSNGPLVPRDIAKEIGQDTFIVGAVLAQLRDSGEILASNTKVGGSPAYYTQGQEERLQSLERFLDPKSKEAYNILKEQKVLRDYAQNVQIRFSLRQLKDFAQDLTVDVHGTEEIFWKWYLTPIDEVEQLILEMIKIPEPEVKKVEKVEEKISQISKEEKLETIKEVKKDEYPGVKEIHLEEDEHDEKLVEIKIDNESGTINQVENDIVQTTDNSLENENIKKEKKESSSKKRSSKHKAKKEKIDKKVKKEEEKKGLFSKVKKFFKF